MWAFDPVRTRTAQVQILFLEGGRIEILKECSWAARSTSVIEQYLGKAESVALFSPLAPHFVADAHSANEYIYIPHIKMIHN